MHGPATARRAKAIVAAVLLFGVAALLLFLLLMPAGERLERAAAKEGQLVIYLAGNPAHFLELRRAFQTAYPDVRLDYHALSARDLYDRFRREVDAGQDSADLLISSGIDLQVKLANDLYAQRYDSPESATLPPWAVWKKEVFAVTAEPVVIGYNRKLLAPEEVPHTHDELAALLHQDPERFRGRIGLYDPIKSPTGYLHLVHDLHTDRDSWDLVAALGRANPRLFTSTNDMIDQISAGELIIAYNLIGSYALERAEQSDSFAVVIPQDYVLVGSRAALISKTARNPAAAKLFLDFLLSHEGQTLLVTKSMIPLRPDMADDNALLTASNTRAIQIGPTLLADLDTINQAKFTAQWKRAIRYSQ